MVLSSPIYYIKWALLILNLTPLYRYLIIHTDLKVSRVIFAWFCYKNLKIFGREWKSRSLKSLCCSLLVARLYGHHYSNLIYLDKSLERCMAIFLAKYLSHPNAWANYVSNCNWPSNFTSCSFATPWATKMNIRYLIWKPIPIYLDRDPG